MRFLAWLLAAFALSGASAQSVTPVSRIEITSSWGGLGRPSSSHVIITNEGGGFRSGGHPIPSPQIDALLRAVSGPAKATLDLKELGLTKEWLRRHAASVTIPRSEGRPELTLRQRLLFQQEFQDEEVVQTLLNEKVRSRHTDDNPFIRVEIVSSQGTVQLVSGSQFAFMLPWRVTSGPKEHEAFNVHISKAVANLLPLKGTNRERLEKEDLAGVVAFEISQRFEDRINLAGVEDITGPTLQQLRIKYVVVAAEINGFHHPEYGKDWEHGDPGIRNLHVSLRRSNAPENVNTLVVLPFHEGKVLGTAEFLQRGGHYEDELDQSKELMTFIRQHKRVIVRVSYVDGSSLGEKGWQTFSADMKAIGRVELINQMAPIRNEVTLLIVGNLYAETYWLLLPDGKMLLWRYNGPSGLLGREPTEAETKGCASYGEFMGGCVGKIYAQPISR